MAKDELLLAKQLIEEEYFLDAIKILKKLQKTKPNSRPVKYELAHAWAASGISIDRAEKYFKKLENDDDRMANLSKIELGRIYLCKKRYQEVHKKIEPLADNKYIRELALSELVYLNIRENNYEKAYEIFKLLREENYWTPKVRTQIETYLGYKLGKFNDKDAFKNYYFGSQLLNYDEERAVEHIKLHLDEIENKEIHSLYLDTIDIDKLYSSSKAKITDINPSFVGIIDKYVLEIGQPLGIVENEEVDSVEVITLPNTYNILAMYPTYNYKTRVKK